MIVIYRDSVPIPFLCAILKPVLGAPWVLIYSSTPVEDHLGNKTNIASKTT
jgi:hypothetical protein